MERTSHPFLRFIEFYFEMGLKYKDIQSVLAKRHACHISERHLKRILGARGLSRRKDYSDLADVVEFVMKELQSSGQLHGYRWMYAKSKQRGLRVRMEHVRLVMRELDPLGVSFRRRNHFAKGPNSVWHIGAFDKLKPYGICIHGSVDGFSRKIIWLQAYTTNSDPKLIGGYYIEAVQRLEGCPRVVIGGPGTENVLVRHFQHFLRPTQPDDPLDSYLEGAANQEIEHWSRFLRVQCMEFWLALFADLRDNGFFDGDFMDKSVLQFCCLGLIQDELDDVEQIWNAHHVRPSKNLQVSSCQPDVMYALPDPYSTTDFLAPVQDEHIQLCRNECVFRQSIPCDPDVYNMCNVIMAESHLQIPTDPYESVNLYRFLREALSAL